MKNKGIFILTGSNEVNRAFLRYLNFVFGIESENIYYSTFEENITSEIIQKTDFWIIEGFKPEEPDNPTGWRTAKKCGKNVFVFFLSKPSLKIKADFIYFFNSKEKLKNKLENSMNKKIEIEDFEKIENLWKELKYEPLHHHHKK
jgi:hypothetical protein